MEVFVECTNLPLATNSSSTHSLLFCPWPTFLSSSHSNLKLRRKLSFGALSFDGSQFPALQRVQLSVGPPYDSRKSFSSYADLKQWWLVLGSLVS